MRSKNNLPVAWSHLLALLGLSLLVGACSMSPTEIGVGLPDVNANSGAFLVDTLTVRASTVLRDSVVTSNSTYLLAGRYTDPELGTLQAKSYFRVGLADAFTPDNTFIFDSVALVLTANTYRYGDTTRTQSLFSVYKMTNSVSDTKVSFASPALTTLQYSPDSLLNLGGVAPQRRARPTLTTIRLPLKKQFGARLMNLGKTGQLRTQEQLLAVLPGIALTSAENDDATLLGMNAAATDAGVVLYYHDPNSAATALSTTFTLVAGNAHCFQVAAIRNRTTVPTASLESVTSARSGEKTFVEGALGLQTRLEFPYLENINQLGQYLTITSASITAQVPSTTLTPFLPTPPSLNLFVSNARNQPAGSYLSGVLYQSAPSSTTLLDQGSYTWAVTSYVQAVLSHTYPNNGLLLASATPELPTRVALGSPRNQLNPLKLRVYVISTK